jgi:hypothetical protein
MQVLTNWVNSQNRSYGKDSCTQSVTLSLAVGVGGVVAIVAKFTPLPSSQGFWLEAENQVGSLLAAHNTIITSPSDSTGFFDAAHAHW